MKIVYLENSTDIKAESYKEFSAINLFISTGMKQMNWNFVAMYYIRAGSDTVLLIASFYLDMLSW